jgi:hypothetical protein
VTAPLAKWKAAGVNVQVRSFAEGVTVDRAAGWSHDPVGERAELAKLKKTFANLRAQMYAEASEECSPLTPGDGYGIPDDTPALRELHRQLGLMPKMRDEEGRLYLPSKSRKDDSNKNKASKERWMDLKSSKYDCKNKKRNDDGRKKLPPCPLIYRFVERMNIIHGYVRDLNLEKLGFLMLKQIIDFCDVITRSFL